MMMVLHGVTWNKHAFHFILLDWKKQNKGSGVKDFLKYTVGL